MSSKKDGGHAQHDVFNKQHLHAALKKGIHSALTAIEIAKDAGKRICKEVISWLKEIADSNTRAADILESIAPEATT